MWAGSVRDLIMPFLTLDPKPYNFTDVEIKDRAFAVVPDPDLVGVITAPNMNTCKRRGEQYSERLLELCTHNLAPSSKRLGGISISLKNSTPTAFSNQWETGNTCCSGGHTFNTLFSAAGYLA